MNRENPILLHPNDTLRDVLLRLNATKRGAVLVVNDHSHLLGIITDGDTRRAILDGIDLETLVADYLKKKKEKCPITASINATKAELINLFEETGISHIPLVDGNGKVHELMDLGFLLSDTSLPLQAVIMAGGRGERLLPLTRDLPKPMLPIGGEPLIGNLVRKLEKSGIKTVHVTTHYLSDKIKEYLGDGENFGIDLSYIAEENGLGTAGGIALLEEPSQPLLVINGDIITQLDFRSMMNFHSEHNADITIAVRQYEMQVPYGVVEQETIHVRRIVEKPKQIHFVNAGVYIIEPWVVKLIPPKASFNMTDLIQRVIDQGEKVVGFPVWEYWRDIGQKHDYEQAVSDSENGLIS